MRRRSTGGGPVGCPGGKGRQVLARPALATLFGMVALGVVPVAGGSALGCSSGSTDDARQERGVGQADETTGGQRSEAERAVDAALAAARAASPSVLAVEVTGPVDGASSAAEPSTVTTTVITTSTSSAPATVTSASGSTTSSPSQTTAASSSSAPTPSSATPPSTAPTTESSASTASPPAAEGRRPDGPGNPAGVCNDGVMLPASQDATCGYAEIGSYCVQQINAWRAEKGLPPFERLADAEACASREARLALEAGRPHYSDDCGWRSQASSGGGRGGEGSPGTIEKSVWWLPKLIYDEGPDGGHYQAMMTPEVRAVACGYYASDRDNHRVIINYYNI